MKLTLKKALSLLVAAAMLLSLAACADKTAGTAAPAASTDTSASAGINRDAVAVRVGDRDITAGEIADMYTQYVSMYQAYGMAAPTADEDIKSLQDMVVSTLVDYDILLYQASKLGYDSLTAEQEAELQESLSTEIESMIEYYSQDAETEGTDEDIRNAAIAAINQELANYGWNTDFEGYKKLREQELREKAVIANLENSIKASASVSDEDVKNYYDTLYQEQKEQLEDPTQYLGLEEDYEMNGGTPMLIVPEGYVRVKVLSVMPEGTLDENYDTLLSEMTALEAEYGNLALAGGDAARITEIKNEYAQKKLEADGLFDAYTADAHAKIREAYAKLQAGESFDDVFAAYNEDTTYTTYPVFAERGRLMMPNEDDGTWDEKLRNAAKGLTPGQYSDIVEIEGSYFIVYLVGEEPAGDVPYDTVLNALRESALASRQETVWQAQQEEWSNDTSIVTYYEDAYRSIGK